MEFEEVRPYVPGDDIRHIDWNVTARTLAPHIKVFREERELTLVLVVDLSGSMGFGSGGRDGRTDKRLLLARLSGALALAAVRSGDRVGLLSFSSGVERFLPPRKSRGHAWAVIRAAFEDSGTQGGTDLSAALERLGKTLRRRSIVCVLSDFLVPPAQLQALGPLARRHHLSCFLLSDPLEERLPSVGLIELEDPETGRRRLVDSAQLRPTRPAEVRLRELRRMGARTRLIQTDQDAIAELMSHFRGLDRLR